MDHFWQEIDGYFTFPDFYAWVARELAKVGGPVHAVEVGVYTGQSAAYLGVELTNLGVEARLDLVDKFTDGGSAGVVLGRLSRVLPIVGDVHTCLSWDGAQFYEDGTLDFVFIDAGHAYSDVSRDIDAWLPKVKQGGGVLAGHDYCDYVVNGVPFGVRQAVNERFKRFEVWPGVTTGGDSDMQGKYWPVWCVRL